MSGIVAAPVVGSYIEKIGRKNFIISGYITIVRFAYEVILSI